MSPPELIADPHDAALGRLVDALSDHAEEVDLHDTWPAEQLQLCARHGVYRWFLQPEDGGLGWDEADLMRGYLRLSASCMTTTFILTQATGAVRRIAAAEGTLKEELLPGLISGERFTTLGISHLTTSRRHLAKPALRAEQSGDAFLLNGFSPWVTGGVFADWVVIGAQLEDGRQLLAALPTDLPGVSAGEPAKLVGLTASYTGAMQMKNVRLERRWLLTEPQVDVMQSATGAKTGGLQTSTLAIGLAGRAIAFVEAESERRRDLSEPAASLRAEHTKLENNLLALAAGEDVCSNEQLRTAANSLVLRAAQAALAAAKGTGYVRGHPAGRWCREALFFLVWSCPQPVMAANLCQLAGMSD